MTTTDKTGAPTTVTAESDRYTIAVEGKVVGKAEFLDRGDRRIFTHTEVDKNFEGRGLATILIGEALRETRDAGLRIVPKVPDGDRLRLQARGVPGQRRQLGPLSSLAMTSHDQAFFTADGDVLVPSPLARGPWGSTISGTYIGGLLGRAVEHAGGDPEMQPARLTVDLLRPVALSDPVQVDTSVEREGRRIRLVDATMRQNDVVVARAGALFLRRGEQPPDPAWTMPIDMPPPPTQPADVSGDFTMELWTYSENSTSTAPSNDLSEWRHGGQKYAWVRDVKPLVDGEAVSPFVRAAMAGDVTSSLTHSSASGLNYINADYTLTLSRLPEGEYIGLAGLTHYSHAGVATGTATLFDRLGPIGSGVATGLANPGFRPPSRG